ncbi:MAG: SPOR domain-containing protein [Rhodocyclales bacterium]|nr:SPOR domain-containing protein [Rhodocyclales bacterium]
MSENDTQLELKKRARRRLVGAIALAALAAIVLPMVMDQAPKQPVQDIQIRIPAQDTGAFTSRILPVKPGATPTPLPPAAAPESKPAEPARQAAAKPEPKAEQKPAPAKAEAQPAVQASKPPEPRATSPVDAKLLVKKPEEVKAKPAPAADNGEQWVVQLGAYRDQTNVRNLTAKLKQQGYNFYTEVLPAPDGSSKTRVRAGPFASKEAAETARERIKRIGVDGIVAQK